MSELLILGTAGGRHEYSLFGQPGGSGNSAALLDGSILFDAGPTVLKALEANQAERSVKELLITHSHWDHCDVEVIRRLAELNPEMCVSANETVLSRLGDGLRTRLLVPGQTFSTQSCKFTALPANHAIRDYPDETPLHYLCETPSGDFLYALDGAWMLTEAKRFIESHRLKLIVWDATCGEDNDWRMFEHNTPGMLIMMRDALRELGVIQPDTRLVLSHLARFQLWNKEAETRMLDEGFVFATDGMRIVW